MLKSIIVLIALCSGVGIVPILLYLIWAGMEEAKEVEEFRRHKEAHFNHR